LRVRPTLVPLPNFGQVLQHSVGEKNSAFSYLRKLVRKPSALIPCDDDCRGLASILHVVLTSEPPSLG
ncbi:MAG: hypothetical protein WB347_08280, partial [Terriglobales bacterium]